MRGWLHLYAFAVSVVCGVVLTALAATRPGWAPVVSCAIYSVTVCGLFGVSALYHRHIWTPKKYVLMKRLDHSMIFVFIGGTYTPFCLLVLSGTAATVLLTVVWAGALGGVLLKMLWPHSPKWMSVVLYVALGWAAAFVLPQIVTSVGVAPLVLLIVGGALYTAGAVLYATRWPNPWPTTFGHHEFFHASTLLAAICHQIAIYFAVFLR